MGYGVGISTLIISVGLYESANVVRQPCILYVSAEESFSRVTSHAVGRGHERHGR